MYKYFVGIDPGSSGAITVIGECGDLIISIKMPSTILDAWKSLEFLKAAKVRIPK